MSPRSVLQCLTFRLDHPSTSPRLLLEVPPVGSPFRPSTPGAAPKRSPSAPSCHRGSLVPSTWFLTTSTASSGLTVRALLQPAADLGVHRVSRFHHLPLRHPRVPLVSLVGLVSHDALNPSKMLPTCSASPHSPHYPKATRSREAAPSMTFHGRHRCRALCPEASHNTVASSPLVFDFEVLFR